MMALAIDLIELLSGLKPPNYSNEHKFISRRNTTSGPFVS